MRIAFVHMDTAATAAGWFAKYGIEEGLSFADPDRVLYRAFGLPRGRLGQVFGPQMILRLAATLPRHGGGIGAGDTFQMPGAAVYLAGRILARRDAEDIASRPDYAALAAEGAARARAG